MKFRPLHDRVLIKVLDSEEKTKGGIIIPDTAKEKPQEGEVVAIGNGAKTEDGKILKMDVKVGDRVLFGRGALDKKTILLPFSSSSLTTFIAEAFNLIPLCITPHKSIKKASYSLYISDR